MQINASNLLSPLLAYCQRLIQFIEKQTIVFYNLITTHMQTLTVAQERTKLLTYATNIMKKGEKVYHSSKYWQMLSKKNNEQLVKDGFEHIKIRQGLDYFNFLVFEWSYWQFQYVWKRSSISSKLRAIIPALTSPAYPNFPMEERQRWLYVYYHCLLWDYVTRIDTKNLLCLDEPRYGNPLLVRWRGRTFSQDLLNSIIETYSMLEAVDEVQKEPQTILEIGGGYGRNQYVLKHLFPQAKIIMVDIVPAIVLAQWYMGKVFPNSKIVEISDFTSFNHIKDRYRYPRLKPWCFGNHFQTQFQLGLS